MNVIDYDYQKYGFADILKEWFDATDLSLLHEIEHYGLFSRQNDQSSAWHRTFYDQFRKDDRFFKLYQHLIIDNVKPRFGENIVYQTIPTFRVHLCNNVAVGEWHKDKHYRDEGWAEEVNEINYYLPMTNSFGNNTIWAESEEDKGDFAPFELDYGQMGEWDGSNLTHGNKINDTGKTRVSVDFRVIAKSKYKDSNRLTINTETPFSLGGYYSEA